MPAEAQGEGVEKGAQGEGVLPLSSDLALSPDEGAGCPCRDRGAGVREGATVRRGGQGGREGCRAGTNEARGSQVWKIVCDLVELMCMPSFPASYPLSTS